MQSGQLCVVCVFALVRAGGTPLPRPSMTGVYSGSEVRCVAQLVQGAIPASRPEVYYSRRVVFVTSRGSDTRFGAMPTLDRYEGSEKDEVLRTTEQNF